MKSIFTIIALAVFLATPQVFAKNSEQIVNLSVTEKGFEPNTIDVKPGLNVVLQVTRKTDSTCATAIKIPAKKIKKDLPLNKEVEIKVGKLEKGEFRFSCGMDMVSGIINVR